MKKICKTFWGIESDLATRLRIQWTLPSRFVGQVGVYVELNRERYIIQADSLQWTAIQNVRIRKGWRPL